MFSVDTVDSYRFPEAVLMDPLFRNWDKIEQKIAEPMADIKVSEWAGEHRAVVNGPAVTRWQNDLTPYAVEPMDTFNLPWVRKIFLEWAPQTGKTSVALNCLAYCIDVDPGPAMYIMPDEKVAKRISRRQLIPMFKKTPKLAQLLGERAEDVTTLAVNFQNGMDLMMAWASSAAALASESIRYLFFDEPGKYPEWSGREADPFSLAEQRQNRYENTSKQMFFSTPNVAEDPFDVLLATEPDETRYYFARCPFCKTFQTMKFKDIHWQGCKDHRVVMRKKLARYSCVHCKMDWDDHTRNRAVKDGHWAAENPIERPRAIAFRGLKSCYSPFVSLSTMAAFFLKAQEDPNKMQAFVTQHDCKAWTNKVQTQSDSELLKHKTKTPPHIVPAWAVALTAGIDVQKVGFWFVVRAWSEALTSHLVAYGFLATFDDVEAIVYQTRYQIADSKEQTMSIWRAAMDTGGGAGESEVITRTEEIYQFLIQMQIKYGPGRLQGIKGASRRQFSRVSQAKEVDKLPTIPGTNRRWKGILTLRILDTFDLKGLLHWRLGRQDERTDKDGNILPADSQRFYLHSETGMDYVRQITSEELRKDRRGQHYWKKKRADNHLLDCEVYAAAAADLSWQPSLTTISAVKQKRAAAPKPDPQPADRPPPGGSGWNRQTSGWFR